MKKNLKSDNASQTLFTPRMLSFDFTIYTLAMTNKQINSAWIIMAQPLLLILLEFRTRFVMHIIYRLRNNTQTLKIRGDTNAATLYRFCVKFDNKSGAIKCERKKCANERKKCSMVEKSVHDANVYFSFFGIGKHTLLSYWFR